MSDIFSSILCYVGQQETNKANEDIAQRQMDFQERLSNSAYQRQVADMSAAGLNPMLAYMKGGGASTPAGSSYVSQSPITAALNARQQSSQVEQTKAATKQTSAQTEYLEGSQTELTNQQINNLKTENDKAKAVIDNLKVEYQNLIKQGYNLTEVGNQIRKNIDLMSRQITNFDAITDNTYVLTEINRLEKQLRKYDVEAASGLGNIGREYNQLKGLLDVFRALTRR